MSNSATDLWPSDLVPQEIVTPHQIMTMQANALNARMNGLVKAEVKSLNQDQRVSLRFEISSATSSQRLMLFEAAHRHDFAYPVALFGPTGNLPSFLREKHYEPSVSELLSTVGTVGKFSDILSSKGRWVANESKICATPQEFTERLKELLASVEIRSAVMSMLNPGQCSESA